MESYTFLKKSGIINCRNTHQCATPADVLGSYPLSTRPGERKQLAEQLVLEMGVLRVSQRVAGVYT